MEDIVVLQRLPKARLQSFNSHAQDLALLLRIEHRGIVYHCLFEACLS